MNNPSIDKILHIIGSKYLLVNIVAKRSKDMTNTKHYQMKDSEYISTKNIGKVLEEIEKGLIHLN